MYAHCIVHKCSKIVYSKYIHTYIHMYINNSSWCNFKPLTLLLTFIFHVSLICCASMHRNRAIEQKKKEKIRASQSTREPFLANLYACAVKKITHALNVCTYVCVCVFMCLSMHLSLVASAWVSARVCARYSYNSCNPLIFFNFLTNFIIIEEQ